MNYKNYNDYELIYMVREKDEYSYNTIYSKYYPVIKKIAYNYYSRFYGYGFEYEDFIQEACIAFHIALDTFNEDQDVLFYTYVITCVERKMISFSKKITCVRNNIPVDDYVEFNENNYCDEKCDIYKDIEYSEFVLFIKKIIYDLDYIDSTILELKINNFSYKEISRLLDMPIRTIQFKSQKIRKVLRQKMYNT